MPPKRRARQQLQRQKELQEPPPPAVSKKPLTHLDIAQSYQRKELLRRKQKTFLLKGIVWICLVGGLLTAALRNYAHVSSKREREQYRVVIVMTTTSTQQLSDLQPAVLESLLSTKQQEFPPQMVYIIKTKTSASSSAAENEKVPDYLQEYVKQNRVFIIPVEKDYGLLNKYYYGVEMESFDTRIIVFDNADIMKPFERTFISNMVKQSLRYQDDVIGFQGATLESTAVSSSSSSSPLLVFEEFNASRKSVTDILKGPIMVQRRFFDIHAFQELVQSLDQGEDIPLLDNVVVAAYWEQQGVQRRVVKRIARISRASQAPSSNYLGSIKYLQKKLGVWKHIKVVSVD